MARTKAAREGVGRVVVGGSGERWAVQMAPGSQNRRHVLRVKAPFSPCDRTGGDTVTGWLVLGERACAPPCGSRSEVNVSNWALPSMSWQDTEPVAALHWILCGDDLIKYKKKKKQRKCSQEMVDVLGKTNFVFESKPAVFT